MMKAFNLIAFLVLIVFVLNGSVFAAPPDFQKDIQPLMTRYCVECHGATKPKSGVRLDSYDAIIAKSRKQSVVPGDPDKSRLVMTMTGAAKLMPPKSLPRGPLQKKLI